MYTSQWGYPNECIQINRAIQLLAGQQLGVEMAKVITLKEQGIRKAKRTFALNLALALPPLFSSIFRWASFSLNHSDFSMGMAIFYTVLFILFGCLACISYVDLKRLSAK